MDRPRACPLVFFIGAAMIASSTQEGRQQSPTGGAINHRHERPGTAVRLREETFTSSYPFFRTGDPDLHSIQLCDEPNVKGFFPKKYSSQQKLINRASGTLPESVPVVHRLKPRARESVCAALEIGTDAEPGDRCLTVALPRLIFFIARSTGCPHPLPRADIGAAEDQFPSSGTPGQSQQGAHRF